MACNVAVLALMAWAGVSGIDYLGRECDQAWCAVAVLGPQVLLVVSVVFVGWWWLRLSWNPGLSSGWFGVVPRLTAAALAFHGVVLASLAVVVHLALTHAP